MIKKLVDDEYPEGLLEFEYTSPGKLAVYAKTVPCLKSDNKNRFYLSGDSWVFKKLSSVDFLVGKLDGMGHGPKAGVIVLAAHMYLDELVGQGLYDPAQITNRLNDELHGLQEGICFTTLSLSFIRERRARMTSSPA